MQMGNQTVVVVGGSSGIGLAVAELAAKRGATVVVCARSPDKLQAAKKNIQGDVRTERVDTRDASDVERLFAALGPVDHVAVTASQVTVGPLRELPLEEAMAAMDSKFWGAYRVARSARVRQGGSIVLVSGLLSRRPHPGMAGLSAVNAALEALGRALALELAPVRVNVVSPGITDTPIFASMPPATRAQFLEEMGKSLPVGRIGRPEEVARAILLCMSNGFMTGSVLDVDGGGLIA